MSVSMVQVSAKLLRESRKQIIRGALRSQGEGVATTPIEAGADTLVRGELAGRMLSWYRSMVTTHEGSIPKIGGEFFSPEEGAQLQNIESELWQRGDKQTPPKDGVGVGVRMIQRVVLAALSKAINTDNFPPTEEDSHPRWVESVSLGLPKLHTPKAGVATATADQLIRQLLGID